MKSNQLLVNGRFLARPVTGVERYGGEILACLGDRVKIIRPAGKLNGLTGHAWEQFLLPVHVTRQAILWSPANTGPLAVSNQVLTVHDLSPLEHPEWFKPFFAAWYKTFLPILVRQVKRVITSSEHMRSKILQLFQIPGDRVVAIRAGVNLDHFQRQNQPQPYGRYILFVGSVAPRKNLPALLTAWKLVAKQYPDVSLVLAGVTGPVFRKVEISEKSQQLHRISYVPDAALPALYSGADIFVMPSFDEGFGLPVLEAMACGTPVVASTGGSLPEVVGDAGLLFPSGDAYALSVILERCLSDRQLRNSLSERGQQHVRQFSWRTTADQVWETLRGANET